MVKCDLFGENLVICHDKTKKRLISFGFGEEVFHQLYHVCEEILNRICRHVLIRGEELSLDTVVKNISKTFYSYYHVMTPRHRLQQPRKVLESKLLKHITNLNDFEKNNKYSFLWCRYKPVGCDDAIIYLCYDNSTWT